MKTISQFFLVVLLPVLLVPIDTAAQANFKLVTGSEFMVAGTSTLHDWTMESKEGSGKAVLHIENGKLKEISSLTVNMAIKSLKSGKSQMDKNAYEALKEDKHPNILFELTEVQAINPQFIKAKGKLTIAGTTKVVAMKVDYKIIDNSIQFTSDLGIAFSEFNLKPPTAVLGTIKTGDPLNLTVQAIYQQQNLMP